jgi:hypothetical protein
MHFRRNRLIKNADHCEIVDESHEACLKTEVDIRD